MSERCCDGAHVAGYRRVLWAVLAINAAMFVVEIVAGLAAGSVSLQADAIDFLGDTASYGISLFVLGMHIRQRARAAFAKGVAMGAFGVWVLGATLWHLVQGTVPHAATMGVVGVGAFAANAAVFAMLWAYRSGDSNMRSVWICSRNDVIGNLAVLLAALGVFGTSAGWPDLVVAAIMGAVALHGAQAVIRHANAELRRAPLVTAAAE